jgi:hypothetical protein
VLRTIGFHKDKVVPSKASNILSGISLAAALGTGAYGAGTALGYVAYEITHLPERSRTMSAIMKGVRRADYDMVRRGKVSVPDHNYRAFQG